MARVRRITQHEDVTTAIGGVRVPSSFWECETLLLAARIFLMRIGDSGALTLCHVERALDRVRDGRVKELDEIPVWPPLK